MKWIILFVALAFVVSSNAARIPRQFGNQQFASPYYFPQGPGPNFPQGGFPNQGFQFPNNQFNPFGPQFPGGQPNQFPGGGQPNQIPNGGRPNQGQNIPNQGQNVPNQGQGNQPVTQRPTQPTQATPATPATTLAPAVAACVEGCPTRTTGEYNPVCGSDGQDYTNESRLECARDCGVNVRFGRAGTCQRANRTGS